MSPSGNQYVRSRFGVPDVILAACWIGLWIAWPSGLERPMQHRAVSRTRMGYASFLPGVERMAGSPDDFIVFASGVGGDDAKVPEQLIAPVPHAPTFLSRSAAAGVSRAGRPAWPRSGSWRSWS